MFDQLKEEGTESPAVIHPLLLFARKGWTCLDYISYVIQLVKQYKDHRKSLQQNKVSLLLIKDSRGGEWESVFFELSDRFF